MTDAEVNEIERRLGQIEDRVFDGWFVRNDTFLRFEADIRESLSEIKAELRDIKAARNADRLNREEERRADQKAREADRRSIRNLALGAVFSGLVAVMVALATSAAVT